MNVTDEIKQRLDIVDFIGDYVVLKRAGRSYKGLCPFHDEKTPSFVVFPDSQQWRCFGACAEGGDIFSFVMKHEGWDFPEALRFLAERAGVELKPQSPEQIEAQEEADRLRSLLADAAAFFYRQLLKAPNAEHAREYVRRRGLTAETVESFELGYAPHSWDATMNFLLEQGYTHDELVDAGMLVVREDRGRVYDRFRNRLVIPIRDPRGNVVGFGARALGKDDNPKYLNSPQSPIFDKSNLLFGFSHARRTIREGETAVIVEGYMDVMQAHQAGFTNVVAEMGTALTEPQLKLLARYANRLILALDPDAAGQMATERGREVIERVSKAAAQQVSEEGMWDFDAAERDYRAKLTTEFDARGMLRYESRMGFDIRVIVLPPGQDPDDLIRDDPDEWVRLVNGAVPTVEYIIQRTTEGKNLDDAKVKSQVASQIIPLIEDVADPVERSHYRQRLARLLRIPETTLFAQQPGSRSEPPRRSTPPPPPPDGFPPEASARGQITLESPTRPREAFCLAALLQRPRLIYRVNRVLAECLAPEKLAEALPEDARQDGELLYQPGLAWQVTENDFTQPEYRRIFAGWQAALDQDLLDPYTRLREETDDPVTREIVKAWESTSLDALLREVKPVEAELSDDAIYEEVLRGVLELRIAHINEQIQALRFLLEEDQSGDALTAQAYGATILSLLVAYRRLQHAIKRYGTPKGRAEAREQGDRRMSV